MQLPFVLQPAELLGGLSQEAVEAPIYDAVWYNAGAVNDGLEYRFAVGALAGAHYLTADMLVTGGEVGSFRLELQEGADGPVFSLQYGLLPEAAARLRMPLATVNQDRWLLAREGALLKPRVSGERVDLRRVDRLRVLVHHRGAALTRWCTTPIVATTDEPLPLDLPLLPQGKLLDELGQSTLREWSGKSRTAAEVTARLQAQQRDAQQQRWPEGFSEWGGWSTKQFEATGFFRTHHDGGRWWLVDPAGYAFWSAGQDCVRSFIDADATGLEHALTWLPTDPEYGSIVRREDNAVLVDYLQANLMRTFGPNAWPIEWAKIALAELRRTGFNTVGNWSDWEVARAAGFPFVRQLEKLENPRTATVYRDMPDVFDPQFEYDAQELAQQLHLTSDDPSLLGYFLMNEPKWGFASETPAAGMLFNTTTSHSRRALADFLRERYGDDEHLAASWGLAVTFTQLSNSVWDTPLTEAAQADLAEFSGIMAEKYFGMLSAACREVDPNHLNLGVRYQTVPPAWCLDAMRNFDVFSMNCYQARVPAETLQAVHEQLNLPTLIGEWHLGALDVGLPATGVGPRVQDQAARGQAYRVYLENAAALPWCVGVHHFTHYDQSALGRFDGECYNIGFMDICHRPYEELVQAARQAHRAMYPVALGETMPYNDEPAYLSRLFI